MAFDLFTITQIEKKNIFPLEVKSDKTKRIYFFIIFTKGRTANTKLFFIHFQASKKEKEKKGENSILQNITHKGG